MATYSAATIAAMNKQGKALLDAKRKGLYNPPKPTPAKPVTTKPYTVPSGSANATGQLNGLPYSYTPPAGMAPLGNQKSGGSSSSSGSTSSTGRVVKSSDATPIDTSQTPSWLGGEGGIGPGMDGINYGTTDTAANDYYDDLLANQEEAARIRTQAALEANNAYIPEINTYNDKRLQDAYISKELNRVNLPQQLSSLGYSGGATETSMLGAMTDYENRRGTIEQDRNDAVGKIRQNAAQIEATGNADLADMSAQYYQNMITKAQRDEATAKGDYTDTIGAYSNDYQAEIDRLKAAGVPLDDYRIKALLAARNEKLSNMASSQADSAQQAFENYIRNAQLNYNINKPYFKPTSGGALSYSEALKMYNAGSREQAVLDALGLL
jgi:hypothetical protein